MNTQKMYSTQSPTLSSVFDEHQLSLKRNSSSSDHRPHRHYSASFTSSLEPTASIMSPTTSLRQQKTSVQCLRFRYFTTFFVCTTCLTLLAASLATHKWLVSKPVRVLRLNNGQSAANLTALMLTVAQDELLDRQERLSLAARNSPAGNSLAARLRSSMPNNNNNNNNHLSGLAANYQIKPQSSELSAISINSEHSGSSQANSKFQGEIYFGLFSGVKVLNHGFGDRVSQLSVIQAYFSGSKAGSTQSQNELIDYRFWLATLAGVVLAMLFALVGAIFAIINFVMTPRGTITGPVGLVIWNAAACFSCLTSLFAWLVEYFIRLKENVLTPEEVQNGWTSENRSQFGYSYYFVVLAFILHLVNIFLVSIVQSETWTNGETTKRQAHSACEGVIMLY